MFHRGLEKEHGDHREYTEIGNRRLLRENTKKSLLAVAGLLLVVAWFYAPALDFGFIWDDPVWYGHALGKSWWEALQPTTDFQFYRPVSMLYVHLFWRADGTFAAPLLHWAQMGWHLLNVALAYAISRRLGMERSAAVVVAALVALYPFSYQAVAWAAPNQPMAAALQNGAWLTYLLGSRDWTLRLRSGQGLGIGDSRRARGVRHRQFYGLSLLLFGLALTVQESTVALAFIPLLIEIIMRLNTHNLQSPISNPQSLIPNLQSLIYPLLALVFGLVWVLVPKQAGITGLALDGRVGLYLLQGFVYPLLGRPGGYAAGFTLSPVVVGLLFVFTVGLLLALALRQGRGWLALFGLVWALLVIAPVVVGLRYSYASLAPRLLYGAAPGVALLWVSALWPRLPYGRRPWRLAGMLLLALIVLQSGWLLAILRQLYRAGTDHMSEMLGAVSVDDSRSLFINFPDRYARKRPPYPLGYWGLTLAPVVVELGDFAAVLTGNRPQTESRSLPWIDAEARANGPYQVDMRGVIVEPDELYELAAEQDGIYLSRYLPDGRFALEAAGSLEPKVARPCRLVLYGEVVCLQVVQVENMDDVLQVQLSWSTETPLPPHLTIFTHLGRPGEPPLSQADGDAWRGLLPLANWRPGDLIHEWRTLARPAAGEALQLQIGVYDRTTGERLRAATADGRPLADDAYVQAAGIED